jgi:hypothetical protein
MTFLETMDALGNLGELIGAIAVFATLGYLAIQVRQNTRALRFQSGRESARLHVDIAIAMMQPDVGATLAQATRGEPLTDVQLNYVDQIVYAWMSALHQDFLEYREGFQSKSWWQVRESTIAQILSFDVARDVFRAYGRQYWSSEFFDVVIAIMERTPTFNYYDKLSSGAGSTGAQPPPSLTTT